MALTATLGVAAFASGAVPASEAIYHLEDHGALLTLNSNGALLAWDGQFQQAASGQAVAAGEFVYGGTTLPLTSPAVTRAADHLAFAYHWPDQPDFDVLIEHRLQMGKKEVCWTRNVQVQSRTPLKADLTVRLESWPEGLPGDTWLPLLNGTGGTLTTNQAVAFRFAGPLPATRTLLALPMVSVPRHSVRLLVAADPFFSTLFQPKTVEWTYLAKPGLENGGEKRTVVVALHSGSVEDSVDCFFRRLLPDVAPGPAWLHQIALVDFDYMSDESQGWFRDIDALSTALKRSERHQAFLCLHGWYDFLGRYCFDAKTGRLDNEWTAFSNYEAARKKPSVGTIGGEKVDVGFENCKPVDMSLAEVHRRLRYAHARGFRVGLYFADGLNAGDGLPDFEPTRVLYWGGWQGPDSKGRSYIQNPLHPAVREFFLKYLQALLAEFGQDMDALVWDETFHVPCGQLGSDPWSGYADRAMLRLTEQLTRQVEQFNRRHGRQIAFLTSDCLGAFGQELKGPYALVSHGTYQDSWCQPQAWSYGLFANYRNVLWSCCWWPVTKWSWVDFGVRNYQAPVSLSNGWGDNKGFSEFNPAQKARALDLFNWRRQRPTRLHWLDHLPSYVPSTADQGASS